MSVIQANGITKNYGPRRGIDGVNLSVSGGSLFGFLGPNGAGKTTTIRVLLGFLPADEGRAEVFGNDCRRASAKIKRDIGYLPGDLRLYTWMTGAIALRLSGAIRGMDLSVSGGTLLERFNLDPHVPVRKMSRGMRQKLGLILALAHEPKLLILDEPTSGLDPLMRDELMAVLRERANAGGTVFFSSHTLSEVEQLCDRVAIVREGKIVADASLSELQRKARREISLAFNPDTSSSADPSTLPPGVTIMRQENHRWWLEMDGEAGQLVAWAVEQGIKDMTIGPPNLETVFRAFYKTKQGKNGEGETT